jgi:ribosomal protein S18 acetylase RimI-like enzyme
VPEQPLNVRPASGGDVAALRSLIDGAYRGESARQGWTHEADLLAGQRIDVAMLGESLRDPGQTILLAEAPGGVVGCVSITDKGAHAYVGLLTVAPALQGQGLGRRLLSAAEAFARGLGLPTVRMTVIRHRAELIAWYVRLGYVDTGAREPFPSEDRRFGVPLRPDLDFVVLEKTLPEPTFLKAR